jgi:hypothetical protein
MWHGGCNVSAIQSRLLPPKPCFNPPSKHFTPHARASTQHVKNLDSQAPAALNMPGRTSRSTSPSRPFYGAQGTGRASSSSTPDVPGCCSSAAYSSCPALVASPRPAHRLKLSIALYTHSWAIHGVSHTLEAATAAAPRLMHMRLATKQPARNEPTPVRSPWLIPMLVSEDEEAAFIQSRSEHTQRYGHWV